MTWRNVTKSTWPRQRKSRLRSRTIWTSNRHRLFEPSFVAGKSFLAASRVSEPCHDRLQQMKALGWGVLAEIPGREIVVGSVTQPWKANVVFHALPPQEFGAFHEPGYVKIAWTLRADPTGPGKSVARHETRAVVTDPVAATRFRWYWSTLSPGIKVIRNVALGLVKSQAENRARETVPAQPLADAPEGSVTYAR